jgi:hypothetical protein
MKFLKWILPIVLCVSSFGQTNARTNATFGGGGGGAPTITVVQAGFNGTFGVGASTFPMPSVGSYNQAAHHCILVVETNISGTISAPTDTSSDTPTNVIAAYTGGNTNQIDAWIFYNVAGNAAEVVTSNMAGSSYAGTQYYDINVGGNCTAANLDIAAHATGVTTGNSISQTITTTNANEAILTAMIQADGTLTSTTQPTSYTQGSIAPNNTNGFVAEAYNVVSSIQTGVTLTWSAITATGQYDMLVVSLHS